MKRLLMLIMLLVAFSAYAEMTQKEVDNFVKSLNWKNAKANQDNSMKVLPNAIIWILPNLSHEEHVKLLLQKLSGNAQCYPVNGKSYSSTLTAAMMFHDELLVYLNDGKTVLDFRYANSPYYIKINDSEAVCEVK